MKTITIHNGTVLEEGKKYKWSGQDDYLNGGHSWNNFRCKIKKIVGIEITIYDYENRSEYIFSDDGLIKIQAKFVAINNGKFMNTIKKLFKL